MSFGGEFCRTNFYIVVIEFTTTIRESITVHIWFVREKNAECGVGASQLTRRRKIRERRGTEVRSQVEDGKGTEDLVVSGWREKQMGPNNEGMIVNSIRLGPRLGEMSSRKRKNGKGLLRYPIFMRSSGGLGKDCASTRSSGYGSFKAPVRMSFP
eukprot:scaffold5347_cov130-Cylindrotheca_fusiformis.AAC.3